ncbi:MAG: alpha/beta hydrolase [Rubrobacter sp.]|nr:alpha/beta hydrolase [Rubrobacter sp.]
MLYRNFATQEELDAQYDLENTVEDISLYADFYAEESEKVRAELEHRLDVPFGPTLAEHLDLYPTPKAEHPAPVLVYLHGGYWRSRTSKEFGFVARGPASSGVATVVVNYALCPEVTIDEIVRQVRAALAWTYKNATSFDGDPERIHVAGHSAGGHLTAMLLETDWESDYGLPSDTVKGACTISGLFDLAPFPYTFLQPKLQLTCDQVLRNSPILHLPDEAPPLLVAYGEDEPSELRRQSEDFFAAWKTKGLSASLLSLPGKNHYDVIDGFLDAESPLYSAILGGINARQRTPVFGESPVESSSQ